MLSALVDGEDLEIERLMEVIATVEGRAALADFLRTRQMVRADDADPPPEMVSRVRATVVARRPGIRLALAAAAVIALVFLGGWWTGTRRPAAPEASPPAVTRTLTFERNVDWHALQ